MLILTFTGLVCRNRLQIQCRFCDFTMFLASKLLTVCSTVKAFYLSFCNVNFLCPSSFRW